MVDESIFLERRVKCIEFRDRWRALGYDSRPQIADEIGVSDEAVKTWETGTRPIPRYAWRALERVETAKRRRR